MTTDDERPSDGDPRAPCPHCGTAILVGARKCRGCKRWLDGRPSARARWTKLGLVGAAAILVASVSLARRPTTVGEAPPLTPMARPGSAEPGANGEPSPAAIGPTPEPSASSAVPSAPEPDSPWRSRTLRVDVHPLDAVFSDDGATLYVSGDDAKIRAYDVATGKVVRVASAPAQGDRLELLHGRYLAVIRRKDAAHIPLLDVQTWDRDATLLQVGEGPADVLALPDGKTLLTASSEARRIGWHDAASGRLLAELRLSHEPDRLFFMQSKGRTFVGALGLSAQSDTPSHASLELFDPLERPFGATRRTVSLGRDPRGGSVSLDGRHLLTADRLSNSAWLFNVEGSQRPVSIPVGQGPIAAFVLGGKYGLTLDGQARTATVIDLAAAQRTTTLLLPESPSRGTTDAAGTWLAVALGGTTWPPKGRGVVLIAGDPPQIVARHDTGAGAGAVSASRDGRRVVVSCYADRELTLLER